MYEKSIKGWLKHWDFVLLELLAFQIAFCLAYCMRHGMGNPYQSLMYRNTAMVAAMVQIFTIIIFNIFRGVSQRGYYKEFISTTKTAFFVMLLIISYLFAIQKGSYYSRIVLITNGIYYWMIAYAFRIVYKNIVRYKTKHTMGNRSLVIITTKKSAQKLVSQFQNKDTSEYHLAGLILTDMQDSETTMDGIKILAGHERATQYLCRNWVDEVYLDSSVDEELRNKIISMLVEMGIVIHIPICLDQVASGMHKEINKMGKEVVLTASKNVQEPRDAFLKRSMDIVGGLIGCFVTLILTIILGPMIYIKSPGPIFFSQIRVGKNGKLFRIYKFRSMYMDAEQRKKELMDRNEMADDFLFKIENDPRIIGSEKGAGKGIGHFIRKTSLDEFPQFLNVLKGDMSLVGTRPPTVDEWEQYKLHHRSRMAVKPGLTGVWQISGRNEIKSFEEVVALDDDYIENWSIGRDVKILLKTVPVVLAGVGAK